MCVVGEVLTFGCGLLKVIGVSSVTFCANSSYLAGRSESL